METLEGQTFCVGLRRWENASLFDGKIMENYVYNIYIYNILYINYNIYIILYILYYLIIYIYRELSIDVLILIENQPCINLHLFRSRISQPRLMTPEGQFENDHLGLSTSVPERLFEVS